MQMTLELVERLCREVEGEAAAVKLVVQQVVECHSVDSHPSIAICPSIAKAAGLVSSRKAATKMFNAKRIGNPTRLSRKEATSALKRERKEYKRNYLHPPTVFSTNMSPSKVKRRTGFSDVSNLIVYIIVVCNIPECPANREITWVETITIDYIQNCML